jgi:hypothetical protein
VSGTSFTDTVAPAPSQTLFLQSPAVCTETAVPFGVKLKPQAPAVQVRA